MAKFYNSLTRTKEKFIPINPNRVTCYCCGPTVYDTPHLGNARPAVVFDVLYRLLHTEGYNVEYARNITDVDDKIIQKSIDTGRAVKDITIETTKIYHDAMKALNVLSPTFEPRATETIEEMIKLTQELLALDFAYYADISDPNTSIYFDLDKFPDHGKLSRHNRDDLEAQEKMEDGKRHPQDFALWKGSNEDNPEQAQKEGRLWLHPTAGWGRPSWHIECSAMIRKYLGTTIDIHAGGADLRFPHHENEIAQSEAANGVPLANIWMHNGMITVNGKKMSKSTGNFITVEDALSRFPGESIRFYMLKTHYRKPFDWTWDGLEEAHNELTGLYRKLQNNSAQLEGIAVQVIYSVADDLNTPKAIAALHEEADAEFSALLGSGKFLGIFSHTPEDWFKLGVTVDEVWINEMIAKRNVARENKDFETSDKIRDELADKGIVLEDFADGTTWRTI